MNDEPTPPRPDQSQPEPAQPVHRRRPRYSGKNPRRFDQKYKEHDPSRYGDTVARVLASGKTPAGTHRPIMVPEILEILAPQPGETAVDCTLGFGGHAREILPRLLPGGKLLGLDVDPIELPKTETRMRELGFGPEVFVCQRCNFAGLPQALVAHGWDGADLILADLGVSSMQIDNPARGFSVKYEGPLDMRMNPARSQTASALLEHIESDALARLLIDNADEPHATELAGALAGGSFKTTTELSKAIAATLGKVAREERELSIRRVFQALRIAVNEEYSALDTFLRHLPSCVKPGGRVAILTFHSGEDRRVKKAFKAGLEAGLFTAIAEEVGRPTPEERRDNPRSGPAKLRWARK